MLAFLALNVPWIALVAFTVYALHLTPTIEAWLKAHASTFYHNIVNSAIGQGIEHAIANVSKLSNGMQSEDEIVATVVNFVKLTVPKELKALAVKEEALYAKVKAAFASWKNSNAPSATTAPKVASF